VDYILHTFAILNYPPHFVLDSVVAKCELRDVIPTLESPQIILPRNKPLILDLQKSVCVF
jgi:hypothetical protein